MKDTQKGGSSLKTNVPKIIVNYTGINLLKPAIAEFALSKFNSYIYTLNEGSATIAILYDEKEKRPVNGGIIIGNILDKHINNDLDALKKKYNPTAVNAFVLTESQLSEKVCYVINGLMDKLHQEEVELYFSEPTEFELNPRFVDLIYYICQENFIITDKNISPFTGPVSSIKIKKRRSGYD